MKAVRGGWVVLLSKRIPCVRPCVLTASPEVFERKLNCRFLKLRPGLLFTKTSRLQNMLANDASSTRQLWLLEHERLTNRDGRESGALGWQADRRVRVPARHHGHARLAEVCRMPESRNGTRVFFNSDVLLSDSYWHSPRSRAQIQNHPVRLLL